MAIPQTFIQELLARADVVDVVGRHVQLKKGGANFSGLCPFHNEKTPSFTVSPSKQFFHCFGCGKNGNAIGFLMEHAGMNFVEAVQDLAQQYGMQVPEDGASAQDRARAAEQRQKQVTLTDVLEKAGAAWRRNLKDSPKAVAYLKGRGLSGQVAARFGLGYAPEGWRGLASVFPNYDDPLLAESGLVIVNDGPSTGSGQSGSRYDRFRDRIMFPIRNVKGECIGFGGRVLDDSLPKYLNSPETPVFVKGRELYGLFEARTALRESGYVLVTEGYMDVVALAQLGFPHAVATLGTACTDEHVQKLFRFTDSVVFSFDGDAAGRRAARKALDAALPFATDTRSIKFLFLPAEHDPDSYIRAFGTDGFAQYVGQASPLSRFLLDAAREGCDLDTAEGRAHMASNARPLWGALPQGALRMQLLSEIAQEVQLGVHELGALWGTARAAPAPVAPRSRAAGQEQRAQMPRSARVRSGQLSREDRIARVLLTHSERWGGLSAADHQMLCALPDPHGALFRWLDNELMEHGARPWGALREALRGAGAEDVAVRLTTPDSEVPFPEETEDEFADAVNRLRSDACAAEIRSLESAVVNGDAAAIARTRELSERLLGLKRGVPATQS